MKKLPQTLSSQIDDCLETIETLRQTDMNWERAEKPQNWVNLHDPTKLIFWGDQVEDQIEGIKAVLSVLRERRRNARSLEVLRQEYKGFSYSTLQSIRQTKAAEKAAEVTKWEAQVTAYETWFSQEILSGNVPNYALAHPANVALALAEDKLAAFEAEMELILADRQPKPWWWTRLYRYFVPKKKSSLATSRIPLSKQGA